MRTDSTKTGLLAINRTIILVAYEAPEMKMRTAILANCSWWLYSLKGSVKG
jgi:hypothetical protein